MFKILSKKKEPLPKTEETTIGGIIKKVGASYCTDTVYIQYGASLTIAEANKIVGKSLVSISATERTLVMTFEGNIQLIVEGFTIDHEGKVDSLDTKIIDNIIKV